MAKKNIDAVEISLEIHNLEEIKKAMAEASEEKFATDEQVKEFFDKWCGKR